MRDELKQVTIYADGAAEPNPGPGGYGVVLLFGGVRKELSGGYRRTTNNRMELMAAVKGLQALKAMCEVTLYSDSKYLVEAMENKWVYQWRDKGWKRTRKEFVRNVDLWKELLELSEIHRVAFRWVKGHAGDVENERCDALAMAAMAGELGVDEGYEELPEEDEGLFEVGAKPGEMVAGDACRKCGKAVERRVPKKGPKEGQAVYFEFFLSCPGCGAVYMVEAGKRRR